jgi:hypothetical protein
VFLAKPPAVPSLRDADHTPACGSFCQPPASSAKYLEWFLDPRVLDRPSYTEVFSVRPYD